VSLLTLGLAILVGCLIVPMFLVVPQLFADGSWPEGWRVRGLCGVGFVVGFLGGLGALYHYWTDG
jgi:hypothetical protein